MNVDNAALYNCCTHFAPPDWAQFAWLETGGCETETNATTGDTWTNGGIPDSEAQFWTVYGRLKEGGCEAITDCPTREAVDAIAQHLAALSGLPVR